MEVQHRVPCSGIRFSASHELCQSAHDFNCLARQYLYPGDVCRVHVSLLPCQFGGTLQATPIGNERSSLAEQQGRPSPSTAWKKSGATESGCSKRPRGPKQRSTKIMMTRLSTDRHTSTCRCPSKTIIRDNAHRLDQSSDSLLLATH